MNIWRKKKRTVNPETWDIKETSPMAVSAYYLEESFQALEQEKESEVKP